MGKSVVQEWVSDLPMMQQTVLLEAIRGCDGLEKRHISKFVLRWLRRCILYSAMDGRVITDPVDRGGGNFTGPIPSVYEGDVLGLFQAYFNSHDEVAHHFHMHLVHAAQILGYKHPDASIRNQWDWFYGRAVSDLHLRREPKHDMDYRLGDSKEQWQKTGGEVLDLGRE